MKWVWTWRGISFGYIDNGCLRTHDGKHVGMVDADGEIYDRHGRYLGEVMNEEFLITCLGKKGWRGPTFTPYARVVGYVPYANYVGYAMYAGYEDFPAPDAF